MPNRCRTQNNIYIIYSGPIFMNAYKDYRGLICNLRVQHVYFRIMEHINTFFINTRVSIYLCYK